MSSEYEEGAIGQVANELNAAWERFEHTLHRFRTSAAVAIPESGTGDKLRWCRFGPGWALIVGDAQDRGGVEVTRAPLDVRVRASAVAGSLYDALTVAEADRLKDVRAAIQILDMATRATNRPVET